MTALLESLAPYAEFLRVGFVNILAFRLRYFTGILTYSLNVTIYYFIWSAVYHPGQSIAGYNLAQMLTYVSVGWIIRSFYTNTIDQEMAYEVIEGKIAMDLIKPVSVQWMWISRAMGESAFRLILLTLPTALVVSFIFPCKDRPRAGISLFLASVLGSFFLMGAINFMIGTCAIPLKSILALIRAKFWLIELLSGLAAFRCRFFQTAFAKCWRGSRSSTSPTRRCKFISATWTIRRRCSALGIQWLWVIALLVFAHLWWERCLGAITIHGG